MQTYIYNKVEHAEMAKWSANSMNKLPSRDISYLAKMIFKHPLFLLKTNTYS